MKKLKNTESAQLCENYPSLKKLLNYTAELQTPSAQLNLSMRFFLIVEMLSI